MLYSFFSVFIRHCCLAVSMCMFLTQHVYVTLGVFAIANPSVVGRLSVVCLSAMFVHPTQPAEIFGKVSMPLVP